ncbi:spermatogenesis-defective protein 39 homolog isoform X1 [Eucyclogobius newberryi]|uniref:spermatogenesis-defective protein 39 homolog isoform X1 n=1 Tax=Eucyclogobius newberryi TaxID=166745 RepID=UPI003B5C0B35
MQRFKEEEDYWNSSQFKAFAFDDDEDDLTKLKESRLAVNSIKLTDDNEDDVEKVNWSGEPVGSISWLVGESSASSNQKTDFPKVSSESSLSKSGSGLSLSALFRGKSSRGSYTSFSDSIPEPSSRLFAPELRRPRADYKDFVGDLSPEESVQRLQQGKRVALERFRSLQDKLLLLDFAVSGNDGNAITAVLIFLKRTLSKEVLFRELESRQTALRHFIHFLTETHEQRLLLDLLRALGRVEDFALLQYKECLNISDENKRRDFLKSCISLPFPVEDAALVQDHFTLLERQIIIEAADSQAEKNGKVELFQKFPRKASILNMPLITTLYYCVYYHYCDSENTYTSPSNLRQTFKVSEKQFFVTCLSALSKLRSWSAVDSLFQSRSWLGFSRKKSPLSFSRVVDVLHKNSAPTHVLAQFVALVEDSDHRLTLAQKHKCHDIVINIFRDLKDRQNLVQYRTKVDQGSDEDRKIQDLLNNSQIRWKN